MSGMTLSEFLLARIAEDEEAARSLLAPGWTHDGTTSPTADQPMARAGNISFTLGRVLAECEAKRQIVAEVAYFLSQKPADMIGETTSTEHLIARPLQHLATVYDDHSDYDEAWRP